jgi:hypothetical protein
MNNSSDYSSCIEDSTYTTIKVINIFLYIFITVYILFLLHRTNFLKRFLKPKKNIRVEEENNILTEDV